VRIYIVGLGSEFEEYCLRATEELAPGSCQIVRSASRVTAVDADVYVWNFEPRSFSQLPEQELLGRSLFLIDPKRLPQFRKVLGPLQANILLKPVLPAALRPFLEHSIGRWRLRQTAPRDEDDRRDANSVAELLDSLLQTNLKLQEYDQNRINFLGRAVHDFHAPLTALCGYCGLLIEQRLGLLNSEQIDLLHRMQQSAIRVAHLSEAMLDLSLGRNSKQTPKLQQTDVETVIGQAVHEASLYAAQKQIQIRVSIEVPEEPLFVDSGKIEQVLVNLLENACKFTPKRGSIDVLGHPVVLDDDSLRPSGDNRTSHGQKPRSYFRPAYRIDVRDSGKGIAREHLDSVFEEYTSYASGADRSGGGLGLAICRSIVEAHNGTIWVESDSSGTQFSLNLPLGRPGNKLKPATANSLRKKVSA